MSQDERRELPLVDRILGSEGGRRLLALDDEAMRRFLSSAEGTALTDAAHPEVTRHIKTARSSLETRVDLVYEGTGFRGIGLVGALSVLEENGFVAGHEAGASAGALVAALHAAGYTATELYTLLFAIDARQFADTDWTARVPFLNKSMPMLFGQGQYVGARLHAWLRELLATRGVATFGDLRVDDGDRAQSHRLHVLVSDLTENKLLVLPRDAGAFGLDGDELEVALAVRASLALPLFFQPVRLNDHVLVDGTLLSDFPVSLYDVVEAPAWPTFGIRLDESPADLSRAASKRSASATGFLEQVIRAQDRRQAPVRPQDAERTITVDTLGIGATELDVSPERLADLYHAGRAAMEGFLSQWDFDEYVRRRMAGGARGG